MIRWVAVLFVLAVIGVTGFAAGIVYSEAIRNTIKAEATSIVRTQFNEALREVCGSLTLPPNVYPQDLKRMSTEQLNKILEAQ